MPERRILATVRKNAREEIQIGSAYRAGDDIVANRQAEVALALTEHPCAAFVASDLHGSGRSLFRRG
ncbi:hypothetical protein FHR71_005474 [Methylobacterium sp. RAS18]|nr:hypothetical protein [Methylobacterium sp. RAS18]